MNTVKTELLITEGSLTGKRFSVPVTGLRLGRSSGCEISIPDPALSRNQCLFELRGESIWVTDLASANGTIVNDEQLGADSKELHLGDKVLVGETILRVVEEGKGVEDIVPNEPVDLGLGNITQQEGEEGDKFQLRRIILWLVALLSAAVSVYLILVSEKEPEPEVKPVVNEAPQLLSFAYEKVDASAKGIYRYYLTYNNGVMSVEIDDVQQKARRVRKEIKLSPNAIDRITSILSSKKLYLMDPEYTGVAAESGTLNSYSLSVVQSTRVFKTVLENAVLPDVFKQVSSEIETFSKNELGIWAVQYSTDKLISLSVQARESANAKWDERDVQFGNLFAALKLYDEAIFYLETVNPKPTDYKELTVCRQRTFDELEKRYREQRFLADRAINLGDWPVAQRELRILCEIVPDEKDQRHIDAAAKLLDVESRMKKGK